MTEHLTEQELIDYAYDLAAEEAMQGAREHLAGCESCRGRLDALKRKFAALNLLRSEIKPSPELIERTAAAAATPAPRAMILPHRLYWFGGIAATIIIGCTLLLVQNADRKSDGDVATFATRELSSPRQELAGADALTSNSAKTADEGAATGVAGSLVAAAPRPPELALSLRVAPTGEAGEQPPFAPASAIELVVLPRREDVQLTIYNSADLTLVREKRNLTLKRGWNWLQFMWANTLIDPTSLSLEPLEQKDKVQVQQLVFPPRLKELGRWLIHSETSGQVPFELTYFTSGLAWRAFYMGTLAQDEKTMRLEGYVRVDNRSGEEYENAQTRLIVGQIHLLDDIAELAKRQYSYGSPEGFNREPEMLEDRVAHVSNEDERIVTMNLMAMPPSVTTRREIQKEGLSEYFLYTIEGTETIPDQWGKRLMSFKTDDIPVKNLYKYDEERYGDETMQFLSFKNDTEHKLGETPLPDGMVRIYSQTDEKKHLSYVSGTDIKYIPVGEEVELDLGPARLVKVEATLMGEQTTNYMFGRDGNVTGWDKIRTWKIEAINTSTVSIAVEITRTVDGSSWQLQFSGDGVVYEKYDVTHARFKLSIEPRSKRTFTYTTTVYRGTREEAFTKTQQSNAR